MELNSRGERQTTGNGPVHLQGLRGGESWQFVLCYITWIHMCDVSGNPHCLGVKVRQPEASTDDVDFPDQFSFIPAHELMCVPRKYLLSTYSSSEATVLQGGNAQMKSQSPAIHGAPDPTTLIRLLIFRVKTSNILL